MIRNNVTRFLDLRKIKYQAFILPIEKLEAEETASFLGVPLEVVFKTIVIRREAKGKPILAVVPGTSEVNLKALAKTVGEKKVFLTSHKEAESLTRLKAGGISPLALLNRGFQVVIDNSVWNHKEMHISGGQLGLNIRLKPEDLIKLTNAKTGEISR
jgi:Cys-tRNA(Pro)/Cys-tRNA(Cys) deacylase